MIASPAPDGQERHAPMPLSTCRTISGIHRAPRRQANSRPSATQSSRPLRVLREATRNESANACSSDSADSAPRSPCGRVRELLGPTYSLLFGQAFRAHFGGLLFFAPEERSASASTRTKKLACDPFPQRYRATFTADRSPRNRGFLEPSSGEGCSSTSGAASVPHRKVRRVIEDAELTGLASRRPVEAPPSCAWWKPSTPYTQPPSGKFSKTLSERAKPRNERSFRSLSMRKRQRRFAP
jgi:hypothetical protein